MKLIWSLIVLLACAASAQTPPPARPAPPPAAPAAVADAKPAPKPVKPTDVVLWIGNDTITAERFDAMLRAAPPQYSQAIGQMGKKQFASSLAMMFGMARKAEKEKLDQTPLFKEQVAFMHMQLLAQLYFGEISKVTQVIPDEEIAAYYKAHEGEFELAKVRGIFVGLNPPAPKAEKDKPAPTDKPKPRSDEETKAIIVALRNKIVGGADFAAVAKESSEEAETAPRGGDLGLIRRGQLPPNIEKAVFALKQKEVSPPVQEATGYYLFYMEELRTTTLDEATPQIRSQLSQKRLVSTLDQVKAEYSVKFNDDYFEAPPK